MGNYLNPGNSGFSNMRNDVYVDKTEMIRLINQTINTPRNLTCISRPRRFGKSFAAKMLCAYYDKTCDSKELFDDLRIAKADEYLKYLNKYDVIYLDMASVLGATSPEDAVSYVKRNITEELPSGNGYADIVYFPKRKSNLPALVVEMKWDKSAEGAIAQIKKRNYPNAIKDFGGEILLVGINYDKDAQVGERKHTCVIEKYGK